MAQLSLLPFILPREWTNDGKLASGCKIYTYQSGTNTPKTTYKIADGSVLNTNPIIADASGYFVCFLGQGAYRIKITDQNDVQIQAPLDGVFGSGSGGVNSESTANATLLLNYNELRALITTPDVVYVAGRTAEGDGGQGWFQYIPTSTELDDDSIILTAQSGSKVYRRIFDGVIDPRWTGLTYGVSIDQATYFIKNTLLSVKYGLPVLYTGTTYINQNVSALDNSSIQMADTGYFISTLSINMVFNPGSIFIGSDRVFGQSISPKFLNGSEIKLSWMAGNTDDERMDKLLLASSDPTYTVIIDESISVLASTWVFPNKTKFINGSIITFTGLSYLGVTIKNIEADAVKIFSVTSTSFNFDFGTNFSYIEWFGGVGDGIVDNTVPFRYCVNSSKVELVSGKTYKITQNITYADLVIRGGGVLDIGSITFTGSNITITDSTITTNIVRSNEGIWRTISTFTHAGELIFTSAFPFNISVSAKFVVSGTNDLFTSISATNGSRIYTGDNLTHLGDTYYNGKKIKCVSNLDYSPWITTTTFIGTNATFDSSISATTKVIDGCLYSNLSTAPTDEEPYLRKAKLPLLPNSVSLATDRNGNIITVGETLTFLSGTDYTMTANGSGWTNGIGYSRVVITPLTTKTALLNVVMQFNAGGVPPVSDTVVYADIDIVAINPVLQYWINNVGSGLMGQVDYCERYDNYANYQCNIPGSVWRAGYKTWTFCGPKGINGAFTGSLNTPNPWMGWRDIWPAASYTNPTQIKHGIGFTQIISVPNHQIV